MTTQHPTHRTIQHSSTQHHPRDTHHHQPNTGHQLHEAHNTSPATTNITHHSHTRPTTTQDKSLQPHTQDNPHKTYTQRKYNKKARSAHKPSKRTHTSKRHQLPTSCSRSTAYLQPSDKTNEPRQVHIPTHNYRSTDLGKQETTEHDSQNPKPPQTPQQTTRLATQLKRLPQLSHRTIATLTTKYIRPPLQITNLKTYTQECNPDRDISLTNQPFKHKSQNPTYTTQMENT